jgi:hypothetical protein
MHASPLLYVRARIAKSSCLEVGPDQSGDLASIAQMDRAQVSET